MAGLDPNSTSQIIKALEQKGLIKRGKSPDGRVKSVCLTAQGATTLSLAMPVIEEADATFFSPHTKQEVKNCMKVFHALVKGE